MEWIPVTARLPSEEDGTVAVLCDDGIVLTAWATYWHGASNKFAQWTHPFDVDDAQVTHWCYLPPLPFNDRVERPCAASGARSARTTGCASGGEGE